MSATNEVDGMAYRELSRMEIVEVVRRWQMGESQRAIARANGETVKKYLRAGEGLGLAACLCILAAHPIPDIAQFRAACPQL